MRSMLGLFRDDKGSTAVEFALVGMMFITALLFTMGLAQILYYNQRLDFVVDRASRPIIVGDLQKKSQQPTLATFTADLCRGMPATTSCEDLIVNLYVVNGSYYDYVKSDRSGLALPPLTPGSGQFTLGTQGQYQYLQVIYPVTFLPAFVTNLISTHVTYKGKPAYLLISTAAFQVEQY